MIKGEVGRLSIDPDDPKVAMARAVFAEEMPVKTDTRVMLSFNSDCGPTVIQFMGEIIDAPLVKELATNALPRIEASVQSSTNRP